MLLQELSLHKGNQEESGSIGSDEDPGAGRNEGVSGDLYDGV